MAAQPFRPPSAPRSRNDGPRATPPLQTTSSRSPQTRYSYMETPVEMQRPVFQQFSSPTNSTIDESPISPASPSRGLPGYDHESMRGTPIPEEKALEAQLQAPPAKTHPAFTAPYTEDARRPQQQRSRSATPIRAPNPPQSPGPIPLKSYNNGTATATSSTQSTASPDPKLGIERRETYNPNSLQGPNVDPSDHRPGQVSHPNATIDPHWKHGLCEPDALCCMGMFCPCMVYGKTMYRLSRKAQKEDPTNLLGYESCNGGCGLFAVGCGIQCKYQVFYPLA